MVLRRPCGCGDDLLINMGKRAGKAWRYYRNQYGMSPTLETRARGDRERRDHNEFRLISLPR